MMTRPIRSFTLPAIFCAALMLGTSATEAAEYTFVGKLTTGRGKNTNVPAAGNTTCGSLTLRSGPMAIARGQNTQPASPVVTGFDWRLGLDQGCVKHAPGAMLTTTGAVVGGAFTLNPQVFQLPYPTVRDPTFYAAGTDIPVAEVKFFPPVVQIATSVSVTAPPMTRVDYGGTQGTVNFGSKPHAAFRKFRPGAWSTQTGRAGPDFDWCPPGTGALGAPGSPGCAAPPYPGFPGKVTYNGGPSAFGGTMSFVTHQVSGVGSIAFFVPGAFVGFNPFGGGEELPTGRGYADYNMITLPAGDRLMAGAMTAPTTLGVRYIGPVLQSQNVLGMVGMSIVGSQPGGYVYSWGFPWTTGTVLLKGNPGGGMTTTFTAMGWDCAGTMQGPACSKTPTRGIPPGQAADVVRNISLVAGSVSISRFASDTPAVNLASMQILPEPGQTLQILAGVIGLLGMAAWRSRRVR